ncbi:hypothetical protein [Peribacillus butanolivorans]|uniref:hypothetical protein n=1 Tax=Peribacillus butanolivorans TaxID=421767 RepID=UPI003D265D49
MGGTALGKANSNSSGKFTVTTTKKQKAGKVLSVMQPTREEIQARSKQHQVNQ